MARSKHRQPAGGRELIALVGGAAIVLGLFLLMALR